MGVVELQFKIFIFTLSAKQNLSKINYSNIPAKKKTSYRWNTDIRPLHNDADGGISYQIHSDMEFVFKKIKHFGIQIFFSKPH